MAALMSWVNGQPADRVEVSDRGLAYGDGLFETIRIHRGELVWLPEHLQRLFSGLKRLSILVDEAQLQCDLNAYCRALALDEGIIKLQVTRGSGGRGYSPAGCSQAQVILQAFPLPERKIWQQGIHLYPCELKLGLSPALAGLKHLNRLEQVLARSEWDDARFQEGLLLDLRGHLVEGTMSNLFLVRDRQLLTPELSLAGVAGIARDQVMQTASDLGVSVHVGALVLDDLTESSEVFCCNSVFGIWPVLSFQKLHWSVGALTEQLQTELNKKLND